MWVVGVGAMFMLLASSGKRMHTFMFTWSVEARKKIKILLQQTPYFNEKHGKFMGTFYAITLFVFLIFPEKSFDNVMFVVFYPTVTPE